MSTINKNFIEKYQILYQKDPKSKVFAPLAEAYRKLGWLDKACEVAKSGVKHHPHFSSGRVALGKVLAEQGNHQEAVEHFEAATQISPENLLAHNGLAHSLLKLRQPKQALKAYKMVLFLNPEDTHAQNIIENLESLSADEYEDDVFSIESLQNIIPKPEKNSPPSISSSINKKNNKEVSRVTSLADSYIIRNDTRKAYNIVQSAISTLGPHPEFSKRLDILSSITDNELEEAEPLKPLSRSQIINENQQMKLQKLLLRVTKKKQELQG